MANWNLYDEFRKKQLSGSGSVNLTSLTVKCMLVTGTYSPNQNLHDFRDDITNEVSGGGYTAGGSTVANITSTYIATSTVKIAGDDVTWAHTPSTGFTTAERAVLYVARGGAASADELIAYSDTFGPFGNLTGDFTIDIDDTNGIFTGPR